MRSGRPEQNPLWPGRESPPAELDLRSLLVPVYLPTLFIMFGYWMIVPILPLFARSLGAGLGITGVMVSMRGVGSLLFDLPSGALISRAGKLPALVAGAAAAVVALATGFVDSLMPLAVVTILMGGVHVLWTLSIQTHLRQMLPSHRRGRAMALIGGVTRLGAFIGPIVGGYLGKWFGLKAAYFGHSLLCLVALVLLPAGASHFRAQAVGHRGEPSSPPGLPFLRLVRGNWPRFLLVGAVVVSLQLLRAGRQTLLPLWGERIGLDVAAIGLVFGLATAVELLLFYPAGMLMDRLGRKYSMVPCLVLLALGLALIPLANGLTGLLIVGMVAGVGNGLGSGIVLTLGADLAPRSGTGEFLGIWHLVGDLGALSGPLLVGAVAQTLGLAVAPLLVAVLGLAGAWLMAFRVGETLRAGKRGDRTAPRG